MDNTMTNLLQYYVDIIERKNNELGEGKKVATDSLRSINFNDKDNIIKALDEIEAISNNPDFSNINMQNLIDALNKKLKKINDNEVVSSINSALSSVEAMNSFVDDSNKLSTAAIKTALQTRGVSDISLALEEANKIKESGNAYGDTIIEGLMKLNEEYISNMQKAREMEEEAKAIEEQRERERLSIDDSVVSSINDALSSVEAMNTFVDDSNKLSTEAIRKALETKNIHDVEAAIVEAEKIKNSGSAYGEDIYNALNDIKHNDDPLKKLEELNNTQQQLEKEQEDLINSINTAIPAIEAMNIYADDSNKLSTEAIKKAIDTKNSADIEAAKVEAENIKASGNAYGDTVLQALNNYTANQVKLAEVLENKSEAEARQQEIEDEKQRELNEQQEKEKAAQEQKNQEQQNIINSINSDVAAIEAMNTFVDDGNKLSTEAIKKAMETNNTADIEAAKVEANNIIASGNAYGNNILDNLNRLEAFEAITALNDLVKEEYEVEPLVASEEKNEQEGYDGIKEAVTFLENALDKDTYYYDSKNVDEALSEMLAMFKLTQSVDQSDIFKINANNAARFLKENSQNLTDERLDKLNDYLEMDDVYNQYLAFKERHNDFNMYDSRELIAVSSIITGDNYNWISKEKMDKYSPVVFEMLNEVAKNKQNNVQKEKSEVNAKSQEEAIEDLLLAARNLTNTADDSIDEYLFKTTRGNLYNGTSPKYQDQVAAVREKEIEYTKILNEKDTLDFSDSKAVAEWFNKLIPYINTHALTLNPGLNTYTGSGEDYLLSIMAENGYTATLNDPKDEATKYIKEKLKELYETNYIPSEYANLPQEFADLNSDKSMAVAQVLRNDTMMRMLEITVDKNKKAGSVADLDMDAIDKVGMGLQNASNTLYEAYGLTDENIRHSIRQSRYKEYEIKEASPVENKTDDVEEVIENKDVEPAPATEETTENKEEAKVEETTPAVEPAPATEETTENKEEAKVEETTPAVEPAPIAEEATENKEEPKVEPTVEVAEKDATPEVVETVDVNKHPAAKFIAIKAFKGIKRELYDKKSSIEIKESIKAAVAKMKETGTAVIRKMRNLGKSNLGGYFAFDSELDDLANEIEKDDAKTLEKAKIEEYIKLVDQLNEAGRIDVGKLSNEALKKALNDDSPEVREAMEREMSAADLLKKDIEEQEKTAKKEEIPQETNSEPKVEEPTVEQKPEAVEENIIQQLVQLDASATEQPTNAKEWDDTSSKTDRALEEAEKAMQAEDEVRESLQKLDPKANPNSAVKEELDRNGWVMMSQNMNSNNQGLTDIENLLSNSNNNSQEQGRGI